MFEQIIIAVTTSFNEHPALAVLAFSIVGSGYLFYSIGTTLIKVFQEHCNGMERCIDKLSDKLDDIGSEFKAFSKFVERLSDDVEESHKRKN